MNRLDKRLSCVASLVRPGRRLVDIGTDHAYLPVWLVSEGRCPTAIASDIGEGPLDSARRTVEHAGLADRIACRLGDGLSTVQPGEVEDIVIAGMGGETIASILEAAPWVKDTATHLILQPMTRAEDLRCWLLHNGFTIVVERLVRDKHHLYPVISAMYTAATPSDSDLPIYAGFFDTEEGKPYRQMMAGHLRRRAAGAHRGGDEVSASRFLDLAGLLDGME